jgi:hypothetical protein
MNVGVVGASEPAGALTGDGKAPSIGAGRSDNSGNETEADPGGITSRFVGLRLAPLAASGSAASACRLAAGGNMDRGRRAGNSGFSTRLTPEPKSGGRTAGFPWPLWPGNQSAGFPRSRFGGPFGGGPWEADGLDWFSGELMRHFSVWLWSLGTENCVPQEPPAWPNPAAPPPLYPLRISEIPTREKALILLNNDSETQSIDYQYLTPSVPYSMEPEKLL